MELVVDELPGGFTRAALAGRMDVEGALEVDDRFRELSSLRRKLIIDLAGVSFMASMGLRTLMVSARSLANIGGRMTLANPQPNVESVLETSGIGELVGVHRSIDEAVAALTS
jgi:anti-anti-sigma factor